MRNLVDAQYFEIPAVPFVMEGVKMYFGDTVFEALNYKEHEALRTHFYNEKAINVRYSAHLDGNYPYVNFIIQYNKFTRTIVGKKIE